MTQYLFAMDNPIQTYAWGSRRALARLRGLPVPTAEPQAELWMGAHPKAPSKIRTSAGWEPLPHAIAKDPSWYLGEAAAAAHGRSLPFLFKVLAVAEPLSIQAHPSQDQAREGYARENRLGIALDAPQRNYRDPNPKPELVCALSPFWALCGFRPPAEIAAGLRQACPRSLAVELNLLSATDWPAALRNFFAALMTLTPERRRAVMAEARENGRKLGRQGVHFDWISRLGRKYPEDIGILAPALLNCIRLEPGEALFLPAGEPHAYLDGSAIEVMANSDNVLRGGLTPKHVDLPELLHVLNFRPRAATKLHPQALGAHESGYPTWAPQFQLSCIDLDAGQVHWSAPPRGAEVLLCVAGQGRIQIPDISEARAVSPGESVFIAAAAPGYRISGAVRLYKAAIPAADQVQPVGVQSGGTA